MSTVFLSYRRSDTAGEVGRLSDSLKRQLGAPLVFRDVADIQPGRQFDAVLDRQLDAAKLVLVLIGPTWLSELERRLQQTDIDYVRVEVAAALSKGKRVIPILLRGATLPTAEALPADMAGLTKRQAITLRDEAWSSDVERLVDAIGRPYRWSLLALRVSLALVAIVVGVWALAPQLSVAQARWLVVSIAGLYGLVESFIAYRYLKNLQRGYLP